MQILKIKNLFLFIIILGISAPSFAETKTIKLVPETEAQSSTTHQPPLAPLISQNTVAAKPPAINARSYVLMDADTGTILAEKDMDVRTAPASLTKIMTLYVAAKALKNGQLHLNDNVYVSKTAWKTGGSRMFIQVGTQVPVKDILQGVAVVSGNDATVALAEHLAGSEESFAQVMNQEAKNLGMNNTNYEDANGLPSPQHYSSARDFAILTRAFVLNYPQQYDWFKQTSFTYNNITQPNRNVLLYQDPTVDGVKTGFTDLAGYCLVASAKRDGMRLISVVMGSPKPSVRAQESAKLLGYGFRFFKTFKFYEANKPVTEVRVWKGEQKNVNLGVAETLAMTVPRAQAKRLTAEITLNDLIQAPLQQGQACGRVTIKHGDTELLTKPLVALQEDPLGGIWTRISDSVALSINQFMGSNDKPNDKGSEKKNSKKVANRHQ